METHKLNNAIAHLTIDKLELQIKLKVLQDQVEELTESREDALDQLAALKKTQREHTADVAGFKAAMEELATIMGVDHGDGGRTIPVLLSFIREKAQTLTGFYEAHKPTPSIKPLYEKKPLPEEVEGELDDIDTSDEMDP